MSDNDRIDDPELIADFKKECQSILVELHKVAESMQAEPENPDWLLVFSQRVDRIMGAASTMGLKKLSALCGLGKALGYRGSDLSNPLLLKTVGAFLIDCLEIVDRMVNSMSEDGSIAEGQVSFDGVISRLEWFESKIPAPPSNKIGTAINAEEKLEDLINILKTD